MPRWTDKPPEATGPYAYRIVRTPPDKPLTGVITTPEITGTNTHYLNHRTIPCEGADTCEACQAGYSWRWHAYVACVLSPGLEHVLLELTAPPAETLANYLAVYKTLRGCWIRTERPSKRPNGRVILQAKYTDPHKTPLPPAPDVRAILCHIWGVQLDCARDIGRLRGNARQVAVDPSDGDGRYRVVTPAN
jgi:hypothetical protein